MLALELGLARAGRPACLARGGEGYISAWPGACDLQTDRIYIPAQKTLLQLINGWLQSLRWQLLQVSFYANQLGRRARPQSSMREVCCARWHFWLEFVNRLLG